MGNEKKSFTDWLREHKTELIAAGLTVTAIIALFLGIKNHQAFEGVWESLKRLLEGSSQSVPDIKVASAPEMSSVSDIVEVSLKTSERIPHNVSEHIRNLPDGWYASAEKIATASEHGHSLRPGQTWVESYRTGRLAA